MEVFPGDAAASTTADPRTFSGRAQVKKLAAAEDGVPVVVYRVEFEDGGRTNWHVHTGPQWLLVIEGRVRVQTWGGTRRDVVTGDAVAIAPGEKHWHGAAPGSRGIHLAVNLNVTTEWLEAVTDRDYRS